MEGLFVKIKYVALAFFMCAFFALILQYALLYKENTYGKAIYKSGSVVLLNDKKQDVNQELTAVYMAEHYNGQEVEVLYNSETAYILEWTYMLRNILFLLMINGVFIILIKADRKNNKKAN